MKPLPAPDIPGNTGSGTDGQRSPHDVQRLERRFAKAGSEAEASAGSQEAGEEDGVEQMEYTLSVEAQRLKLDKEDGCMIGGYRNEAPRPVMPAPGGPVPRTKGQVGEAAVRELMVYTIVKAVKRARQI